jgi:probable poly-beta-1,6-N-acetyl-D-glucosamine export protein
LSRHEHSLSKQSISLDKAVVFLSDIMIRKFIYIKGLAIISVVLYHATGWGYTSMFWWTHRYRPGTETNFEQLFGIEYYTLRIIEQLIIFAIPAFIFVSGYYITVATGRTSKTISYKTLLNLIRILAVPFIIWSVIYLLYYMIQGTRYSLTQFVFIIISGNATPPFYFVPLLIQLYILSPLLVFLIKKNWKPVLLTAVVIQLLILSLRYISIFNLDNKEISSLTSNLYFPSYLFWFVLGIVVGFNSIDFKAFLTRNKRLLIIGSVLFFILGVLEWELIFHFTGQDWIASKETLVDNLYAFCLLLGFLAYEKAHFPFQAQITRLSAKSFGIYLSHMLALEFIARGTYHVFPAIMEYTIAFFALTVIVGLAIPLLLMVVVQQFPFRRYYSYVFG